MARSESDRQNRLRLHLKNDTRKTIFSTIMNQPGITGKELTAKLGLDKSTIHWHISELWEDNIIHVEKDGRFNKHYPQSDLEHISITEALHLQSNVTSIK